MTAISNLERNREAIGQALERMFNVIAEEPVSFVLWVWVGGEQIQVSNADREGIVEVLRVYLRNGH